MPCDSVTAMKAVYKAEHYDKLVKAAEACGFTVKRGSTPERVRLSKGWTDITVTPGRLETDGSAQEAGALLKKYAEAVFDSWVEDYPDRHTEVESDGEERVFVIGSGSDPYGGGGW